MADSAITFTGPGGVDPMSHILHLEQLARPTTADCLLAGQYLRTRIRERTASGVDADGVSFPAYSEAYAAEKGKHLGHADIVDLFGWSQHPHMLNSIVVSIDGQAFEDGSVIADDRPVNLFQVGIYDEEAAMRAQVHNEGATVGTRRGAKKSKKPNRGSFAMPRRHFFDANHDDLVNMERIIGENIDARLNARH